MSNWRIESLPPHKKINKLAKQKPPPRPPSFNFVNLFLLIFFIKSKIINWDQNVSPDPSKLETLVTKKSKLYIYIFLLNFSTTTTTTQLHHSILNQLKIFNSPNQIFDV